MSTSQDVKCQHNFDRAECHECHEIAGKVVLITDMFLVGILSLMDPSVELKYALEREGGVEVNAPYTSVQDVLSALLDDQPDLCIDIGIYLLKEGTARVRDAMGKAGMTPVIARKILREASQTRYIVEEDECAICGRKKYEVHDMLSHQVNSDICG